MTNQILKTKKSAIVIGHDGISYATDQWKKSNTFWISQQENLMITDNQTALFENADPAQKHYLTKIAWGE